MPTCQWIEGDPGNEEAQYCGAPSLPRQAWCEAHARRTTLPIGSAAALREIARFHLIAANRKMGRDTTCYVDLDFDLQRIDVPNLNGWRRVGAGKAP